MSAPDPAATEPSRIGRPSRPEPRYGRRRRAPRYGSFVFTGVVVGVVLAVIVSFGRPATGQFSQNSVVGYVAAIFGLVGALVGAVAAVLLDRRKPPTP